MRKLIYSVAALFISGSANAAELIVNGNFEAGNAGFTSDYRYVAPANNALRAANLYTVTKNARTIRSSFASFGDHTSGRGNYLIADGALRANSIVWQQSNISFVSNTEYIFKGAFAAASDANRASFQAYYSVDGGAYNFLGSWFPERPVGVWQEMEARFVPRGQRLTITIFNRTILNVGNNFALDDIRVVGLAPRSAGVGLRTAFAPLAAVPEPATWGMMIVGFGLIGWSARRRRTAVTA